VSEKVDWRLLPCCFSPGSQRGSATQLTWVPLSPSNWPCPSQRWLLSCGGEIGWSATATSQAHVTGFDRRAPTEDDNVVARRLRLSGVIVNHNRYQPGSLPREVFPRGCPPSILECASAAHLLGARCARRTKLGILGSAHIICEILCGLLSLVVVD
jgi:hypothetical protein